MQAYWRGTHSFGKSVVKSTLAQLRTNKSLLFKSYLPKIGAHKHNTHNRHPTHTHTSSPTHPYTECCHHRVREWTLWQWPSCWHDRATAWRQNKPRNSWSYWTPSFCRYGWTTPTTQITTKIMISDVTNTSLLCHVLTDSLLTLISGFFRKVTAKVTVEDQLPGGSCYGNWTLVWRHTH